MDHRLIAAFAVMVSVISVIGAISLLSDDSDALIQDGMYQVVDLGDYVGGDVNDSDSGHCYTSFSADTDVLYDMRTADIGSDRTFYILVGSPFELISGEESVITSCSDPSLLADSGDVVGVMPSESFTVYANWKYTFEPVLYISEPVFEVSTDRYPLSVTVQAGSPYLFVYPLNIPYDHFSGFISHGTDFSGGWNVSYSLHCDPTDGSAAIVLSGDAPDTTGTYTKDKLGSWKTTVGQDIYITGFEMEVVDSFTGTASFSPEATYYSGSSIEIPFVCEGSSILNITASDLIDTSWLSVSDGSLVGTTPSLVNEYERYSLYACISDSPYCFVGFQFDVWGDFELSLDSYDYYYQVGVYLQDTLFWTEPEFALEVEYSELPDGLIRGVMTFGSLSVDNKRFDISGTPEVVGDYPVTFTVKDDFQGEQVETFTITLHIVDSSVVPEPEPPVSDGVVSNDPPDDGTDVPLGLLIILGLVVVVGLAAVAGGRRR